MPDATATLDRCVGLLRKEAAEHKDVDLVSWASVVAARQYRILADLLLRHVPPGAHVLDWGAGGRFFSYWLVDNGYRVTAYDLKHSPLADVLLQRGPERFATRVDDDPRRLPFEDATFDAVTSVGVLEHVRETGGSELESLAEIRRVLRPRGQFVCAHLPNRYSWIEFAVRRLFPSHHRHRFRYRPSEVRHLLGQAGFQVGPIRPYGALPRNVTNGLPGPLRQAPLAADVIDAVDRMLGLLLRPFVQNYAFVAIPYT